MQVNNGEDFHEDHLHHAIVSGDSDDDASGTSDSVAAQIRAEEAAFRRGTNKPSHADDLLYDHKLDDEDEDYVYTNMRGGAGKSGFETAASSQEPTPQRHSDAVLSCPSCFNIVCMDCQRHQRYHNQFRAMFVMGITVNWNERLVYDQAREFLVPKPLLPHHVPPETTSTPPWDEEESHPKVQFVKGEYFPVLCASCETQVAALDMPDGVYHFYGCLESSN